MNVVPYHFLEKLNAYGLKKKKLETEIVEKPVVLNESMIYLVNCGRSESPPEIPKMFRWTLTAKCFGKQTTSSDQVT